MNIAVLRDPWDASSHFRARGHQWRLVFPTFRTGRPFSAGIVIVNKKVKCGKLQLSLQQLTRLFRTNGRGRQCGHPIARSTRTFHTIVRQTLAAPRGGKGTSLGLHHFFAPIWASPVKIKSTLLLYCEMYTHCTYLLHELSLLPSIVFCFFFCHSSPENVKQSRT